MLTQVYELLITQLHIFRINFINILSYYRYIRYLVFPALFLSIGMVFIEYTCITSVTEYSKSIRLLLKRLKVLSYGVCLTLFFMKLHLFYFEQNFEVKKFQRKILNFGKTKVHKFSVQYFRMYNT